MKSQALASRMAPLPGVFTTPSSLAFSPSSWPAAKNTYFLCCGEVGEGGVEVVEYVVVFDQVSQCCYILHGAE